MLSPADADLVTRDHALPGLALLLDPEAFTEALRSCLPNRELGLAEIDYLRYKPGTNCLAAFTIDVAGSPITGYAKVYGPNAAKKLCKAQERTSVPGPLGEGRFLLKDDALEITVFPNDNKLDNLSKLYTSSQSTPLLRSIFSDRPDLRPARTRGLRYKPERRYVAQLRTDDGPQAVLKLYTADGYGAALAAARAFHSIDGCRVPQRIGCSERHHVLAFEWLPGYPLSDVISSPAMRLDAVEQVGGALAILHTHDGAKLAKRSRTTVAGAVREIADGLSFLYLPAARLGCQLAHHVTSELMRARTPKRPTHGDFYARQVLLDDDGVIILDLDEAILADPAADLGMFLAHLELDALRGDVSACQVEPVREAFLRGYGNVPDRVDLYTAIGLIQLAPHHFRNREPDWPERTLATLERAAAMVGYCHRGHAPCPGRRGRG